MAKEQIPRRPFGKKVSNNRLPPTAPIIGLGCSSFANNFVESESEIDHSVGCNQDTAHLLNANHKKVQEWIETLKHAVGNGINLLDTAPWYGHGSSEIVIGLALKHGNIDRTKIIINTKIGRYDLEPLKQFDFSYDMTIRSVQRSIERMGCEYIDVLQLHDPEFSPSMEILLEETIPAMLECRKRGWAKALGLTGYPLETHYNILKNVEEKYSGSDFVVFDQALTYGHFNLHNINLCSKAINDETNSATKSLMEYCHSQSIAMMAAAPLSMGLLTHNPPPFWHPATDALKEACQNAANLAKEYNVNLPMLAILFALAHDGIGCTLLGMGSMRDVNCAIAAVKRYEKVVDSEIAVSGVGDGGKGIRSQIEDKLAPILDTSEQKVLSLLLDGDEGPFKAVWDSGNEAWDGLKEADNFWSNVKGGKAEAEIRMRVRS